MFEQHHQLSCFVIDKVSKAMYSANGETIAVVGTQGSVYEFKIPQTQHYQKVQSHYPIVVIKRIEEYWFCLDSKHELVIRCGAQEQYRLTEVKTINFFPYHQTVFVFIVAQQSQHSIHPTITIGAIRLKSGEKLCLGKYLLREEHVQDLECPQEEIQQSYANCFLVKGKFGSRSLLKIDPSKINLSQSEVVCQRLKLEIDESSTVIGSCKRGLVVGKGEETYFISTFIERIVSLQNFPRNKAEVDWVMYQEFILVIIGDKIWVYEAIEGTLLAQMNIGLLLLGSQEGSNDTLFQHEGYRYSFLLDECSTDEKNLFIFDKEKLSLFRISIAKILEHGILGTVKEEVELISEDENNIHQNTLKTVNFRLKKLQSLDGYLQESLTGGSYRNALRFLVNEQNIFVLSDGLSMLHKSLLGHLDRMGKADTAELQRQICVICKRLISQSKYEHHISNGLTIVIWCYSTFQKAGLTPHSQKSCYQKILDLSRVKKCLGQSSTGKKKHLIELCLELSLKVRGYQALEDLTL